MSTLDYARPGVAAQAVGASQGALDLANVYANRRKQFGHGVFRFRNNNNGKLINRLRFHSFSGATVSGERTKSPHELTTG